MTDGPDVPGEWDPSGQAEPPAALLRRAISHVEQLLQRLERPGADGGSGSSTPLSDLTPPPSTGDDSAAIEPVVTNPVRRISSAAQAEALRVSLNAHEKANRLLAEASAIRAQSASEGEQILVEARELADRMQAEAGEEAALYVNRAREESEHAITQATAEVQRARDAAHEEAERVRAEATVAAQQLLAGAEADSSRMRTEAETEAQQLRAAAHEETERARREAHEEAEQLRAAARDEADRLRGESAREATAARESAKHDTDALRSEAEQLRDSVQTEADRLLKASSEEAQRLREAAQRDADRIRSDAESQARVDRLAADDAIREAFEKATVDADQIRAQAREQGQAEAESLIEARVQSAVAEARAELDTERVRVYELLGTANASVADVRTSMRDLVEALGRSMGSANGATGSLDALMGRLRDVAAEGGVDIPGPPVEARATGGGSDGGSATASATGSAAPAETAPPGSDNTGEIPAVRDEGDEAARRRETAFDIDTMFGDGDGEGGGEQREGAEEDAGEDSRRPLGLLFGASHKSRASKR